MNRCSRSLKIWLLLAVATGCPALLPAKTVVYPVEAIADLWQLGAADFQTKFGGINVTGLGLSDEGWYVRYQHENLTLLFGPLPDRETARRHAWELESVRDAAIRNRASLASSKVDFVRFTLTGRYGSRGAGGGGDEDGGEGAAKGNGTDGGAGADAEGAAGAAGAGGAERGSATDGEGAGQSGADGRGARSGRENGGADGNAGGGAGQGDGFGSQQVAPLGGGQSGSGAAGAGAGQGSQAGQSGSAASGQSAGQGAGGGAGTPGTPGTPSSGQSGGADPLSAIVGLFRRILGL